ncbi:hypothetical protein J2129_001128 [Methanofollis sp. W23]|uniref:hypothetical protein n=1 Tax=Methanofollis sp. W23 TaxID=2817849 RepID=UPI001AE8BB1F|nr:hypothetical protein [Methanofollis sp. W23]MBP2145674.1 hypothetical protein [Methanofollis sp. W23]
MFFRREDIDDAAGIDIVHDWNRVLGVEDEQEVDLRQIETVPIITVFEEQNEMGVTGQAGDVIDQG